MNNPKLAEILKYISIFPGTLIIIMVFFFGSFTLSEGYNMFNPYADTEFAKDYSPEKFQTLKEGMTMKEIKNITGEPLNSSIDTAKGLVYHSYTRDGYLRRNPEVHFTLAGDLAWLGSSIEYGKDSIAKKIYFAWYYD